MLNKTEFFAGIVLLFVCALFAWQIYLLPEPAGNHTFTPGSFPKGVVTLLTLLSLRLLYKSLKRGSVRSMWPEKPVLRKIGVIGAMMAAYILSFAFFGAFCYENGLPDGTAFISTTSLFLFFAQHLTRPGKAVISLAVSAAATGLLFVSFYYFFQVQLP